MMVPLLVALAGATLQPDPVAAIELKDAWATPSKAGGDVVVFLVIANIGLAPFAVLKTTSELTDSVVAVGLGATGPQGAPMPSAFAVLPKKVLTMGPEGPFLRLTAVRQAVKTGETLFVKVHCPGGLELIFDVPVQARRPPSARAGNET